MPKNLINLASSRKKIPTITSWPPVIACSALGVAMSLWLSIPADGPTLAARGDRLSQVGIAIGVIMVLGSLYTKFSVRMKFADDGIYWLSVGPDLFLAWDDIEWANLETRYIGQYQQIKIRDREPHFLTMPRKEAVQLMGELVRRGKEASYHHWASSKNFYIVQGIPMVAISATCTLIGVVLLILGSAQLHTNSGVFILGVALIVTVNYLLFGSGKTVISPRFAVFGRAEVNLEGVKSVLLTAQKGKWVRIEVQTTHGPTVARWITADALSELRIHLRPDQRIESSLDAT